MWKNIASMEWNAEKDDNQDSFSQDQSALPWAEQPCTTLCGDSTISPSRPIDMGARADALGRSFRFGRALPLSAD
jgi:hypothetical protein